MHWGEGEGGGGKGEEGIVTVVEHPNALVTSCQCTAHTLCKVGFGNRIWTHFMKNNFSKHFLENSWRIFEVHTWRRRYGASCPIHLRKGTVTYVNYKMLEREFIGD